MHTHILHIHFHLISWFAHTARHISPLVFYNQGQCSELFFKWKLSQVKHCCGTYSLSFKVAQTSQCFFQVLPVQTAMVRWESLHIKCYATYTSPQAHVIYKVIFKTILHPNTYYKTPSTPVQQVSNRMVLVKPSMSQPLTSLCLSFFLSSALYSTQLQSMLCINSHPSWMWLVTVSHTLYQHTLQIKSMLEYLECTPPHLFVA